MPVYIRICPDEEIEDIDDAINKVVTNIKNEVKNLKTAKDYDFGQFNNQSSVEATSTTLVHFISNLISNGEITKQCLSISQAIQYNITKCHNQTTLGLAVKLHHEFASKELINILHNCGFIVSYVDVSHFKKCAAIFAANNDTTALGLRNSNTAVSVWCDTMI